MANVCKVLPFLDGWFYAPTKTIPDIHLLKAELTSHSRFKRSMSGEKIPPIYCFDDTTYDDFIGLPPRYALDRLKETHGENYKRYFTDKSSVGSRRIVTPKEPDLNHPRAHPDQKILVPQLINTLRTNRFVLLQADCGFGKSACALSVIAQTKLKPVIFVDQEQLKQQWLNEIEDKLGIPKSEVGIIQGKKCQVDKDITIAMVKTLMSGKYKDKIKDQFGIAIFDEIHVMGAEKVSKVLGQTNTWCAIGMSATTERADGRDKVYKYFFGSDKLIAEAPALPVKVIVLPWHKPLPDWAKDRNGKILAVARDKELNSNIADLVADMYLDHRNILVVADHKKQLQAIYNNLIKLDVPKEVCGHLYHGGTDYSIKEIHGEKVKEKAYFDWIKAEATIIFATNGIIQKGVSINRLDGGVDCSPRSDDIQLRGRIRRPFHNKRLPLWYTIHHKNDYLLSSMAMKRISSYIKDKSVELVRKDGD